MAVVLLKEDEIRGDAYIVQGLEVARGPLLAASGQWPTTACEVTVGHQECLLKERSVTATGQGR